MRGLPSIVFIFRNELNKFNKTGARVVMNGTMGSFLKLSGLTNAIH